MIDVTQHINAVRREVGSRTLEAGEATVVTLSRVYDTTLEDLWGACTNLERIPRWFLPVTGELRLGGHYALDGNASGKIKACDPPNGFRATWEMFGEVSWIELRLEPEGAEARASLSSTSRTSTTSAGRSSGPGRWASAGTSASSASRCIWRAAGSGRRRPIRSGPPPTRAGGT